MRPEHLGIEYNHPRWQPLFEHGEVIFTDRGLWEDVTVNGVTVGSLEQRPHYCDRGHWWFKCDLPDLDEADGFPRYYMDEIAARDEIAAFLYWRLWRDRVAS